MSVRDSTLRHMNSVVARRAGEVADPEALGTNEMRLYSYYKPSLGAGTYSITAKQTIVSSSAAGNQTVVVRNTLNDSGQDAPQQFEVVVPHFSLDRQIINSYYPPDGHQDEGRVLPHIVFNDPHYPWEIPAGTKPHFTGPIDSDTAKDDKGQNQSLNRNLVPWVALLVFDPEELYLSKVQDFTGLGVPGYTTQDDVSKQNANGTFQMTVEDYFKLPTTSRVNYEAGFDSTGFKGLADLKNSMDVIFPTKKLFLDMFVGTLENGTRNAALLSNLSMLESYKYMAHVRQLNRSGFPDNNGEDGFFSIVVSPRLGKFDTQTPKTQICHLVSIENIDSTLGTQIQGGSDRIGMVSLFSWMYTAIPGNPVNFIDTARELVSNQQMLRIDEKSMTIPNPKTEASDIMRERLSRGYTLARWRTQSGEETAAFLRGPLVPQAVPSPVSPDMADHSNTGQDYQILDPKTGLMDLSYSSAWQLGKMLAISDSKFNAALLRFRSLIHNTSVNQTQMMVNQMIPSKEALASLTQAVSNTMEISNGNTAAPVKVSGPSDRPVAPALQDPKVAGVLVDNIKKTLVANASAGDGDGREIYNEFNLQKGNNSDWMIILSWISDKLFLDGIPPQYLLPEPACLPPESLRFFYIDDFWLDCLIDGALSVANHLNVDDDVTRRGIKEIYNSYLSTVIPRVGFSPQIPCYGFFIRSNLLKATPDLRITVTWKPIKDGSGKIVSDDRATVSRWTKWDDQTLLCLLDRQPQELDSVTLVQPPHQQRFSLGTYVRKSKPGEAGKGLIEFSLRRLYTVPNYPTEWPLQDLDPNVTRSFLNFDTRVLNIRTMASYINQALRMLPNGTFPPPGPLTTYTDAKPNSCEFALELNDPSYIFKIVPPSPNNFQPTPQTQSTRQLYVNSSSPTPSISVVRPPGRNQSAQNIPPKPNPAVSTVTHLGISFTPFEAPESSPPAHIQTRIKQAPASRLFSSFVQGGSPLTTSSQFELKVFPDYKEPPTRYSDGTFHVDDYFPSNNTYFYDLIFSIRKISPSTQELLRIDIDIPVTAETGKSTTEALLNPTYTGLGVRMISNNRFHPFLFYNASGKRSVNGLIHIELVPRSAQDSPSVVLSDVGTEDISFRLADVPISPLNNINATQVTVVSLGKTPPQATVSGGLVKVAITEWYKTTAYSTGEPTQKNFMMLKLAKTDDA